MVVALNEIMEAKSKEITVTQVVKKFGKELFANIEGKVNYYPN